jgi:hypothetical protein
MGKKKEKKSSNSNLKLIILGVAILFVFFFLILISLYKYNYEQWEESFLKSDAFFLNLDENTEDLEKNIEKKILDYNRRSEEYTFIEFSNEEFLFLFGSGLSESSPDWLNVKKSALISSPGRWVFYFKSSFRDTSLPWIGFVLTKEDMQSVDLFVEDILIGNVSVRNISFESIVEDVNEGINHSMRLINDGNFAGKVFENIELGSESVTIKSRSITF